jgi:hypothetical protein
MKAQDIDKIRHQLDMVERWRASGMGAHAWAQAHGVEPAKLTSWLGHERLWRQRLAGGAPASRAKPAAATTATGFASVHVVAQPIPAPLHTIRIEHPCSGLVLHWPLSHSAQLAHWLGLHSGSGSGSNSSPVPAIA